MVSKPAKGAKSIGITIVRLSGIYCGALTIDGLTPQNDGLTPQKAEKLRAQRVLIHAPAEYMWAC